MMRLEHVTPKASDPKQEKQARRGVVSNKVGDLSPLVCIRKRACGAFFGMPAFGAACWLRTPSQATCAQAGAARAPPAQSAWYRPSARANRRPQVNYKPRAAARRARRGPRGCAVAVPYSDAERTSLNRP